MITRLPQSRTFLELLENLERTCKVLFKVAKVSYFFTSSKAIELLHFEGANLQQLLYNQQKYFVFASKDTTSSTNKVEFKFNDLLDVKQHNACHGRTMVAPILHKLKGKQDKIIMLVQMEYDQKSTLTFEKERDFNAFSFLQKIISSVLIRIFATMKTKQKNKRVFGIQTLCA